MFNNPSSALLHALLTALVLAATGCANASPRAEQPTERAAAQARQAPSATLSVLPMHQVPEAAASSRWDQFSREVLMLAMSLTGVQYKYGGTSPDAGFDCSGFVRYVFQQAANMTLPHGARAISQVGQSIATQDLKPGDLVFFDTLKSAFSHVGIYIGNNRFIHAPSSGGGISIVDMTENYWRKRYNGARRLEATNATETAP